METKPGGSPRGATRIVSDHRWPEQNRGLIGTWCLFALAGSELEQIRELKPDELSTYKDAKDHLWGARRGDLILWMAEQNWYEFVEATEALVSLADETIATSHGAPERALHLNRRLANYLASMRLYLDYEEKRIKRRYGKRSSEAKRFKAVCAQVYDDHWSYRFACRLRNFSQHHGPPIGRMEHTRKLDPKTGKVEGIVSLAFDVGELLEEGRSFWGSLSAELESRGPLIDVFSALDDVAECLRSVRDRNRLWELPKLKRSATRLVEVFRDGIASGRRPWIGRWAEDEGRLAIDRDPSPVPMLQALGIEELQLSFDVRALRQLPSDPPE